MAIVNTYILYCVTRNENQRSNCHLAFLLQKVGERFAKKGATLAQNNVLQALSRHRLSGRHFADRIPPTGNKGHPPRVYTI
jgi:hypothetical protein